MDSQDTMTIIKTEIDNISVEENTLSIKYENDGQIEQHSEAIPEIESDITQESVTGNMMYDNIQIVIKQEDNITMQEENLSMQEENLSTQEENSLLIERHSEKTKSVKVIENITKFQNKHVNCHIPINTVEYNSQENFKLKEENVDQSLVSDDYTNFDDTVSMDSNEAVALGNVEACLQDEIDIKYENDGNDEEHQNDETNNPEVKMESDLTETVLTTNQSTSDVDTKYSFVMKIPGEVVSNIDQIITSCIVNGSTYSKNSMLEDNSAYISSDTYEDSVETSKDHYQINSNIGNELFTESTTELEDFQLNSITGNVLSLEQEAYGLLKNKKKTDDGKLRLYPCSKCSKIYHTKYTLKAHMEVHKTIENYRNGVLKGQITRQLNLKKKMKKIEEYNAKSESAIIQSQNKLEKKEGYKCTCDKVYKRRSRMETCLRSHEFFETNPKCVPCMTCSKQFKSKEELALHRKRYHRKKFPCKFCPTDYETRKELFKHLQIHQKVQLMEYKVIEEVVKNKKKLRCFMCSKSWTELSELKTHVMSAHKGPYSCSRCKNTFPKIIDFGNHTKTYHPEVEGQSVLDVLEAFSRLVQEWRCEECNLQFLEADKLALHQIEHHNPELRTETQFQCPDCRRVFISQKGLKSHRRIHHPVESTEEVKEEMVGIMCLECRKICKDMNALTSHMRFHSPDRKYPCKFCDFRFATQEKRKAHIEIHIGDMKYVCFICEYQCSSENRLKQHKMSLKHANMKEYLLTGKPLVEESSSSDKAKEKKSCGKKRKKIQDEEEKKEDSTAASSHSDVACDVCGDKFSSEEKMLEHKQTHPFIEFPNDDKPSRIFFK